MLVKVTIWKGGRKRERIKRREGERKGRCQRLITWEGFMKEFTDPKDGGREVGEEG